MAVFFILAGWFFDFKHAQDLASCIRYARKRLVRLWWPAFFWGVTFILCHNLFARWHIIHDLSFFYGPVPDGYTAPNWSMHQTLLELAKAPFLLGNFTKLAGAFWFLKSLLFASVGYCAISWLLGKWPRRRLAFHTVLAFSLPILGRCWHTVLWAPVGGESTLTAYALIHLGVLLRHFDMRVERLGRRNALAVGALCLAALIVFSHFGTVSIALNRYPNIPFMLVCSLCGWYFLMTVSSLIHGSGQRLLAYVGAHTMPVILLHFLAFKIVSCAGVLMLGLPSSRIADFSVTFTTGWWWLPYAVVGIGVPLALSEAAFHVPFFKNLATLDINLKRHVSP